MCISFMRVCYRRKLSEKKLMISHKSNNCNIHLCISKIKADVIDRFFKIVIIIITVKLLSSLIYNLRDVCVQFNSFSLAEKILREHNRFKIKEIEKKTECKSFIISRPRLWKH